MAWLGDDLDPGPVGERPPRRLSLRFGAAPAFRLEFERNLSKGGLFVPTREPFEAREVIEVELLLEFCGRSFVLPAEVVDVRPPELEVTGAPAGVAVQILRAASVLRRELGPIASAAELPPEATVPSPVASNSGERRRSEREPSRAGAELVTGGAVASGSLRDLSTTGALVELPDDALKIGDDVRVALVHPVRGERLEIDATVVRRIEGEGDERAVALEFEPSDRSEMVRFVEDVQAAEHAQRLAAVHGSIAELGVASLLQMFGTCARQGTIELVRDGETGRVAFEAGQLCGARLGTVAGSKALARLLAWESGRFEFHGSVDPTLADGAPQPLDAAIFDGMRLVDERARAPLPTLPLATVFRVDAFALAAAGDLDKTEQAAAELAAAGLSLGRILDVIPEPDAEVLNALAALLEHHLLEPR